MIAATFGAVFAALYAAHHVADYWVQSPAQSAHKGLPGWPGRIACAAHVGTYTLTAAVVLAAVWWRADLHLTVPHVVAGLAVSAASHYWADRRSTLRALTVALDRVMPGKSTYYDHGGAAPLDQSWHTVWVLVAALVIA